MNIRATDRSLKILKAGVLLFLMINILIVPASADVTAGENENPVISVVLDLIAMIFDGSQGTAQSNKSLESAVLNETLSEPEEPTFDLPIVSEPAGAEIYLDNISMGQKTPYTRQSVDGKIHNIRLELEGYETYETTLRAGDGGINASLIPIQEEAEEAEEAEPAMVENACQTGSVYVDSCPYGARIYIDNKETAFVTPKLISGLKKGKHTIRVKMGGVDFGIDRKVIWIDKDTIKTVFINTNLFSSDWEISLKSDDYSGDSFTASGRTPEKRLPASVDICPMRSFITILKDGNYMSFSLPVWGDGDEFNIREQDMEFGKISVDSTPAGAAVFVDGFRTEQLTPCILSNISEGQHIIRVSRMDCLPDEEMITLIKGPYDMIDRSLSFSLEPYSYGSLEVTSEPAGASIYIHERPTGLKTPHLFTHMAIGTYNEIRVSLDKESEYEYDVLIAPDRCTHCDFNITG